MPQQLTIDALTMAITQRCPSPGLLHHSDRGSQGGFKWSSQHPPEGSCDDQSKAAFGSIGAGALVVTRSAAGGGTR
jgi:putative transposase